jgi:hypothetical protein
VDDAHLSPVQRQAELWDRSGRPESLLLQAPAIAGAEAVLRDGAVEREFLAASRQLRAREAETARLRRESRWQRRVMGWGAIVGLVIAVIVLTSRCRDEQAHAKEEAIARERRSARSTGRWRGRWRPSWRCCRTIRPSWRCCSRWRPTC